MGNSALVIYLFAKIIANYDWLGPAVLKTEAIPDWPVCSAMELEPHGTDHSGYRYPSGSALFKCPFLGNVVKTTTK